MEKMTINLKSIQKNTSTKKPSGTMPDDYKLVIKKYIDIYQGCWIKYEIDDEVFQGGFLIEVTEDSTAVIRNIRKQTFEINITDSNVNFYCKIDSPNHKAVRAIVEAHERLALKITQFNAEKQKFLADKLDKFKIIS